MFSYLVIFHAFLSQLEVSCELCHLLLMLRHLLDHLAQSSHVTLVAATNK